jgi:hypothetical protein
VKIFPPRSNLLHQKYVLLKKQSTMKKYFMFTAFAAALLCYPAQTQAQTIIEGKTEVIYPTHFSLSKPLRELAPVPEEEFNSTAQKPEMKDKKLRVPFAEKTNPLAEPQGEDPAMQKTMGTNSIGAPLATWTAQNGNGTPPDPSGAAGPNHYVQAVNSYYKIYNKTGGNVAGPLTLGSLLFGSNAGDPIVMYDKFADRWVITEFDDNSNDIYIAVSQTADPTGSYYSWTFTSPAFPDYLKFSIWTDGYYMTANFGTTERLFVFERSAMLTGAASPKSINKTYSPPNAGYFFCPLAAFADGQLPPAGTPCPIVSYEDDGWGTSYDDAINIYDATVNWTASTLTIALKQSLLTSAFDASYNASWDDITQPSTTAKLDGIGGVFTYRAQYRVWSGYNTLVLNMGVKVSSTQRSIRWYELRQNQSTGSWSIYQQSTYSPDTHSRWCGSIAMDDNGSIGMGYAKASSTVSASACYTGRNSYDALNQMTYTEETAAAGSGAQTFTNRFGDYSQMSIDPSDGSILWFTGEYLVSGSQRTKVFSFRIPYNTSIDEYGNTEVNAFAQENSIVVNGNLLPTDEELVVDLFDINGKFLAGKKVTPAIGTFETQFSTNGLTTGIYLVRVGKNNTSFQRVIKVAIQ